MLKTSGAGSATTLGGTVTARTLLMNQDLTTCESLQPRFSKDKPITLPVSSVAFDGKTIKISLNLGGRAHDLYLQLSGQTLVGEGQSPGSEPTVFRRQ
jgi:hypothetical protein